MAEVTDKDETNTVQEPIHEVHVDGLVSTIQSSNFEIVASPAALLLCLTYCS